MALKELLGHRGYLSAAHRWSPQRTGGRVVPVAMPEHRKMSERSTRDSVSSKRRRFWSLSPSSRRPLISAPSDFRHVSTAADPFLDYPEPTPSRASNLRPAKQLPHRPYRPLELSIYQSDNGVSPIMPHFEPRPANPAPSSDYSGCVSDSQPEEVKPSLEHQKSFSDSPMSFHFPRRQALGSAPSSSHGEDEIPPLIPPKSPGRPRAYSSPDVEKVKERVANAMLEVEKLQKQIDDVIERQSLYVPSRPPTPHSVARTMPGMSSIYGPGDEPLPPTSSDLEPMPSIPALPPAAPSFAQRLNSDIIERPHTAPIRPPRTPVRTPITPPRRSRTPGEQRSPSTPPSRPRRDDMPPPPPLPLVLRPPLRKKKSFSRVSSWLFPGSQHNRNMSFDSVTNAPRPIRGNQGFYQVSLGGASEHRRSTESVDTVTRLRGKVFGYLKCYGNGIKYLGIGFGLKNWFLGGRELLALVNIYNIPVKITEAVEMVRIPRDDAPSEANRSDASDADAERGRLLSGNDDEAEESYADAERLENWHTEHKRRETRRWSYLVMVTSTVALITVLAIWVHNNTLSSGCEYDGSCNDISKLWGQYSSFFSVPSEVDSSTPDDCEVTIGIALSRHGARYPTAGKTTAYSATIARLQKSVTNYGKGYEWLSDYEYNLGSEDLTDFGQDQMIDSGKAFYERYIGLAEKTEPFIRASGSDRVIMSSHNFTQGFYASRGESGYDYTDDILVIPEEPGINNTLSHGTCSSFEDNDEVGDNSAQTAWGNKFLPPIRDRLNRNLHKAKLSLQETIYLMDLCPFNIVNTPDGVGQSRFCDLFSIEDWRSYDYYMTLGKYYEYGNGNAMGPTQGVGYVNELVSRLTRKPVDDRTTTNRTLDGNPETFPLDRALYADFSHDNTMVSIFSAMGLYNSTSKLPKHHIVPAIRAHGYSSAWVVPFAARIIGLLRELDMELCRDLNAFLHYSGPLILNSEPASAPSSLICLTLSSCVTTRLIASQIPWDTQKRDHRKMVSTAGGIVIAIIVLLVAGAVGWVVFTQLRARRLGLPPPSLASYLPWHKEDSGYGIQPAPSGIAGWFNDKIRKFKNRNNRSAAGAYEQSGGARGRRGFGPLDPDEAWDSRVGNEADQYGYYEEDVGGRGRDTGYGGGYNMNLAATPGLSGGRGFDEEEDRGRRASRSPASGPGGRNPFDDDAGSSLRGVSPRPIDTGVAKPKNRSGSAESSPTERRSVFRENM
ncbi:histidine phosphatase superfamily [Fusarium oxysporum]|nr:histidine phosphatase superfamily [Fusarium oxysporum]